MQRSLVYGLSLLLIWQPMLLAAAEPVSPTHSTNGRPTLDQAANGVPIVNIQNPNGRGVSQNFYNELNVGNQGLILNNSQQLTQTQLGGYIEGNPNLTNGSANLILNEVIGTNPSKLNGYMEVGGRRADVVVANPNGITCNGCGFINTNHATLTTGKAIMEGGSLRGFDVQGGNIHIGENGLNGSNTNRFDLIARSVEVAGELHANELNVVAGQQTVDHKTLATSNVTTDGEKPAFAIDSTALGGMYANRIRLIANEDGVGVRLDAPVAAQNGDLVLSAEGTLSFGDARAKGNMQVASAGTVSTTGSVVAGEMLDVDAKVLNVEAGGVGAEEIRIRVDESTLASGASMTGESGITVHAEQAAVNEGEILAGGQVEITTKDFTNTGTVAGQKNVHITASDRLVNSGQLDAIDNLEITTAVLNNSSGALQAGKTLALTTEDYQHLGEVQAEGELNLEAENVFIGAEADWQVLGDVSVKAADLRNEGVFSSSGSMTMTVANLENHGDIAGMESVLYSGEKLSNAEHSLLLSAGQMQLYLNELDNFGDIYAVGDMDIAGGELQGELDEIWADKSSWASRVNNESGLIASEGSARIVAANIYQQLSSAPEVEVAWDAPVYSYDRDYDRRCFNRNKNSACHDTTYRNKYRRQSVQSVSAPRQSRMLVGGDLWLLGDYLLNNASVIAAGSDIEIKATRFENVAITQDLKEVNRVDKSWLRKKSSAGGSKKKYYTYTTIPTSENWSLCDSSRVRCNRAGATSHTNILTETVINALVSAGGKLNIDAELVSNGEEKEGAAFSFGSAMQAVYGENGQHNADSLFRFDPLSLGFSLPGEHGLFLLKTDPGHPYLIETNPLFASLSGFMGSQYLINRLGMTPDREIQRLGDSYYETMLVRDAILAATGKRFLDPDFESDEEQFRWLMDNAFAAAESLELSVGVALTADQVNALQQDIVWLEEKEVAGYRVMVPVLYLAKGGAVLDGPQLRGEEVLITGEQVSNHGEIHATNTATINAGQGGITNSGGMYAGESLSLRSDGDIKNLGGQLIAQSLNLDAEGSVEIATLADAVGDSLNWMTRLTEQAELRAENLRIRSAGDIQIQGAQVNAGVLALEAGGDLSVGSVSVSQGSHMDQGDVKFTQSKVRQLGSDLNSTVSMLLETENDLSIIASDLSSEGDINLKAKGDIVVGYAQESDSLYSYRKDDGSFGKSKTQTLNTDSHRVVGSNLAALGDVLINASKDKEGNLVGYQAAKGNVTLSATDVQSEGDILIASAGSLTFDSAANTYSHEHHKTKKGTISARQSGQSTLSITHQGTRLQSADGVQMMGLDGITLENTDVSASGDLIASAGLYATKKDTLTNDQANFLIRDVQDIYQYDSYKESSKADIGGMVASVATLGLGGGLAVFNPLDFADVTKATVANALNGKKGYTQASGNYSATSQGSNLNTGGSLLLQSAGNLHIQGSSISGLRESGEGRVEVEGSTALLAGTLINTRNGKTVLENDQANLSIIAGENYESSYYEREKFGVDYLGAVGGALTQMASAASGAFTGDFSGPEDLPDDVSIKREGQEQRTESITLTHSAVQDSQHLTLSAGNDMTAVASQIVSGGNISMTASGDVNLNAGLETLSDYQANYGSSFDNFTGGYDRGRLYGGIEGERYREETLYERGSALSSLLQANGLISIQVGGDVNVIGSDVMAGGLDAEIGGEMRVGAAQEYERTTHKSTNENISLTAGVGNSYVDAAYAADDFVKASEAVKNAYDALQAAKDDPRITDISDYEANLALALLQQQAVGIQAATSVSGAVENAPAFGFYGDVQMATEITEHTSTSEALTHRGSQMQLGSAGMSLGGDALTLQGSRLDIQDGGGLDLKVDRFTVEAVADTYSSQSSTETQTSTLTLASSSRSNLAGAAAVDALSGGLGTQSSEQQSQSQYWQYGAVNVDGLMSLDVKDQTTIHGGSVWAKEVTGSTGNLTVSSLQNTSTSEHSNQGVNFGGGKGFSVNGGFNTASGSSERAWVDQVSGFHGEEVFDLRVDGHTQVTGAVISGGDPNNFTLDTATFAYTDIQDYDRGSNSGWGISTSFNPLNLKEQQKAPEGSTTFSAHRNGHEQEGLTYATVGEGVLIVRDQESDKNSDLAGLNRDVENVQEIIRDELTGGLDVELTVDHRLFTKRGRSEIARDVSTTLGLPQDVVTSVIKVLGDRKIIELGVLIHEHGLTRKLTEEIKRLPEYEALRQILSKTMGVPEDQVAERLRTLLAEIGSVAAENPEQLQQAIAGFSEAGEQGADRGVKDGSALKIALHRAVGEALGGAEGASAAGINEMLMPLLVQLAGSSPERLRALSRIVGGASAENAQGAWIAEQGTTWNRQLHQNEVIAIRKHAKEYALLHPGMSEAEALSALLLEGMRQVDATYADRIYANEDAARFLAHVARSDPDNSLISTDGLQTALFSASDYDFKKFDAYGDEFWNVANGIYPGGVEDPDMFFNVLTDMDNASMLKGNGDAYYLSLDLFNDLSSESASKGLSQIGDVAKVASLPFSWSLMGTRGLLLAFSAGGVSDTGYQVLVEHKTLDRVNFGQSLETGLFAVNATTAFGGFAALAPAAATASGVALTGVGGHAAGGYVYDGYVENDPGKMLYGLTGVAALGGGLYYANTRYGFGNQELKLPSVAEMADPFGDFRFYDYDGFSGARLVDSSLSGDGGALSAGGSRIFSKQEYLAPSGRRYNFYSQDVDLNLEFITPNGRVTTNREWMAKGNNPYVLNDQGMPVSTNQHHSQQRAAGPIFELQTPTHTNRNYQQVLHPFKVAGFGKNPFDPVDHSVWNKDRQFINIERLKRLTENE
ncbi:hemagglutinin repeat-containing protein [Alcanivorax sp. DP30]|uniref:two-partner secretion domain-containing protein n=1 Tax=Alcanivorax sp. DP30 TaxID=2606217 RepID=UPI00137014FF|nr:hemagglutinin repeat-containing protein [Alcanivorax sp. DP30]